MPPLRLHFSAIPPTLPGVTHVPIPAPDRLSDFVCQLPWPNRSVESIVADRLIEKLPQAAGGRFFHECRRIMMTGAILRVVTADIDMIVDDYANDRISAAWEESGIYWTANRCDRLNLLLSGSGVKWLYNEEELARVGDIVGLRPLGKLALRAGETQHPAEATPRIPCYAFEFVKPQRRLAPDAQPLVTIAIPSYKPQYFEAALRSALDQTYRNIEVVICDDCPDDGIRNIAETYATSDSRVRYLRNPQRLARQNVSRCFEVARGEFFKLLCDDDLLDPTSIDRMLDCFRQNDDITLVTSKRQRIDENDSPLPEIFETLSPVPQDAIVDGLSLGAALLSSVRNFVGEPTTALFRKDDLANIRPDYCSVDGQTIRGINDIAAWVNLATRGDTVYLTDTLSQFRCHPEQNQIVYRDLVVEYTMRGIKIMRASWDRLGLSRNQFFGAILWKPTDAPHDAWKVRTIVENFAGWKDVIPDQQRHGGSPESAPTGEEGSPTANDSHQPAESAAHVARRSASALETFSYRRWMNVKSLDEQDARIFQEHANTLWKTQLLFEFCLVLKPGSEHFLADSIDAISQQYYDGWRLSIFARTPSPEDEFTRDGSAVRWMQIPEKSDPADLINAHLTHSPANWIGFFECGTRFAPQLLLSLSDYLAIRPEWRLIYTDEDALDGNGDRISPLFKPDFNLELLRSADYIGGFFVERSALASAGGYSRIGGAEHLDIALKVADAAGDSAVGHIPDILVHIPAAAFRHTGEDAAAQALREHLVRRNLAAEVFQGLAEGTTRRVMHRHPDTPMVSIVVPTRNRPELLRPCVGSLFLQTRYPNWELLLVDNGSDDPSVLAYYDRLSAQHADRVRVLHFDAPFNFSAMNNLAARQARGDYLLLLNNDTECIHDDWLDAMMSHAQRPDVGIVGARLLFPDSLKVQHAGVVLGMTGTAGHVFQGSLAHDAPGYLNRALSDQEYSAVTGACMLIRKSLFEDIGGLDEETFRISFNDIDLCLKVRQRGYRIIWTPFATLLHHGSATQTGDAERPLKIATFQKECNDFYSRWTGELANDSAWNRNLSLIRTDPVVEDELTVPWNLDFHDRPRILVMPAPTQGTAEYRSLIPLRALHSAGKLQFASVCQPRADFERAPMPAELARMAPDTLVMHTPVDNVRCQALLSYHQFNSDVFRIYSLDDLITSIPENNPTYRLLPPEVMTERLALGLKASHRLVVSTEPLRAACRHLIDDIRLVPNSLPWSVWGDLQSRRRRGRKPRVGWAGAQQHAGDLRFVQEIVEATHRDVDWVFLGMLPNGARPFVAEYHDFIHDFATYPAALASLDLDLAIAPLELHPFNEAKSNLRLLEYGILGWPVLCTDILPYRTDNPPVTLLPNEAGKWIAAIRERIVEPEALAREGDALREWVKRHYLLENRLDEWLSAFLR